MAKAAGTRNNQGGGQGGNRPRRDGHLHNVNLEVREYTDSGVKGVNLATGKELAVEFMTPARAARMLTGTAEEWQERFKDRVEIAAYADPNSTAHVKPGGVLQLNNVRLDFSNSQYYAHSGYGMVQNPETQALMRGLIALDHFEKDNSIRLQVFDPKGSIDLTSGDVQKNRAAVKEALTPVSPVGSGGTMPRVGLVVTSVQKPDGTYAFSHTFLRSASEEKPDEPGAYVVSTGFAETLAKTTLDKKNGPAFAIIASLCDVPFEKVAERLDASGDPELVQSLRQDYDFAKQDGVKVSMLPGYTVPIFTKVAERLKTGQLAKIGAFEGAAAVNHVSKAGEPFARPAAYAVMSERAISRSSEGMEIGRLAVRAHMKQFNIELPKPAQKSEAKEEAKQEAPAQQQPRMGAGASLDF